MGFNEKENSLEYWDNIHSKYERNEIKLDNWLDKFETIIDSCSTPILDLGCGSGNDTLYLINKNKQFFHQISFSLAIGQIKLHKPQPVHSFSLISTPSPFFAIAEYIHELTHLKQPSSQLFELSLLHMFGSNLISSRAFKLSRAFPLIIFILSMPLDFSQLSKSFMIFSIIPVPLSITAVPICTAEAPKDMYSITFLKFSIPPTPHMGMSTACAIAATEARPMGLMGTPEYPP